MSLLFNVFTFSWLNPTRESSDMDSGDEPPDIDQELIGSTTSEEEVISALARHGCSDLTADINLATCSDLPRAGGGFCDVYQGSLNHGTKIAIKSLRLYDQPGKENEKGKILKRAARELYYWSRLKHPNVLPLMGLAMFRGRLSMISEWMENGNLMAYLSLNSDVDRVGLCVNVCAGLSYIHDNGMVHGDLKAANIMVSHKGVVMIADFGNSQLRELTLKFTNTTSSSLSAPELLNEDNGPQVSKKSDVYAYGMTVLETLTGKVPFEELSERKVLSSVILRRQTPARPANGAWAETRKQNSFSRGHLRINESAMPEMEPKRTSGSDDLLGEYQKRLRGLSDLATEYFTQGQLGKSEMLAAEVLAVQKRVLGADHRDTLWSMHRLAATFHQQGRLAEAESLFAETLALWMK